MGSLGNSRVAVKTAGLLVRRGSPQRRVAHTEAAAAQQQEAADEGAPFMEGGDEEEWQEWVDWSQAA